MNAKKTYRHRVRVPLLFVAAICLACSLPAPAISGDLGYFGFGASGTNMGVGAPGRKKARIRVVKNAREFRAACNESQPLIIEVSRSLDLSNKPIVSIRSNKLIRPGKSRNGKYLFVNIRANLRPRGTDVIIERISVEGPRGG
jgi:hypothetical protein